MDRKRKRCSGCGIFFSSLSHHYKKSSCDGVAKKNRSSCLPDALDSGADGGIPDDLFTCNSSDMNIAGLSDDSTTAPDNIDEVDVDEMFIAHCNPPLTTTSSPSSSITSHSTN
jgi:hypothetical protein